MKVTRAVIPANGRGTRLLPATKAIPKEMLPVAGKPMIQHAAEEAVAAGLDDILLITGRGKHALEDHFDSAPELERALAAAGDTARLAMIRQPRVCSVRQGAPAGLGDAVLCAAQHVGNHPFAVLLADNIFPEGDALLRRMAGVYAEYGTTVIALQRVAPEEARYHGCAAVQRGRVPDVVTVTRLVEKPPPGSEPGEWAVAGRYVCNPAIFAALRDIPPGHGGEIQFTDALNAAARDGEVRGVLFAGRRYDAGNPAGYLRANVELSDELTLEPV